MASKSRRRSSTRNVLADFGIGDELHAFGGHLLEAAIDDVLLQLEFGNAVAQQSADAVVFLVDRDRVAGAAQLLRGREPAGPEPTTATFFPVRSFGGSGRIQPSRNPRSTIFFSICLIVTGRLR